MDEPSFRYVAIDPAGKRVRGVAFAPDPAAAFEQLRRQGLSPLSLKASLTGKTRPSTASLRERESADFLSGLADLLRAGSDIRTALSILGGRFERPAVKKICDELSADISGGEPLDMAFGRAFQKNQAFVAPMVAAGEAAGDLAGGLHRAAEVIYSRLKLRDQLISVLAYPGFVLVSAIAAIFVILLFIVPSIAPLAEEMGAEPPPALAFMIAASDFLRANGSFLAAAALSLFLILFLAARAGALIAPLERLFLDGPARRTVSALVFGSFSISLGTMLAAGAPMSDALRLAIRSAPTSNARRRLDQVAQDVRQGEDLSAALAVVKGFPPAIVRLAAVGEASNAVGALMVRSGKMEEEAALRRIDAIGKIMGPALIVLLGAILGVLMAGLLSGVSQMGQSALE